jgi:polyhydroxyalkanoate synthase
MVAAHLAHTGQQDRLAAFTLMVTVLDQAHAGLASAVIDERTAKLAEASSRARGYLDGRSLAEVFAWLRPNDLIWNYWVNNYLLGKKPAPFDILFWNADTTRMTAGLHRTSSSWARPTRWSSPAARPCSAHRWTWPRSTATATSSPGSPTHLSLAELLPDYPAAGGRPGSCCRPAGTWPRWSIRRATRRPGTRWPRSAGRSSGVAAPGRDLPRVLVAGLRGLADRALRRGQGRPGELGGSGLVPVSEAPGTYVYDH